MVSAVREVYFRLARMLGKGSGSGGGEPFLGREAVGNTTDDHCRLLYYARHSSLRIRGK